jgi:hypothetical protein
MPRFIAALVIVGCWLAIASGPAMSAATSSTAPSAQSPYERPRTKGGPYKQRVVVFVHGIFGDADGTWRYSSNVYWPKLLLTDDSFRDSDVYVAAYSTPYLGNTMNLDEVVTNLNNRLVNDEVFSKHREVVFVCHSLGGLVVQRLLLTFRGYAAQVPFIYFFSTPETGAQIAKLASVFSADPLLRALLPGDENGYLQNLENEWKASQFHIHRLCAYEKKPYKGVLVVDRLSGTRNCDAPPIPINEDHVGIVKPSSTNHDSYIALRNALNAIPISRNGDLAPNSAKKKNSSSGVHGPTDTVPALPTPKDKLREQGLALSKEILGFLADRQQNNAHPEQAPSESGAAEGAASAYANRTPKYLQETLVLFGDKFEYRISDIHDRLSSRGLQDTTLDASYRNPARNIFGNIDKTIKEIADSIHKLALLVPPEGLYNDLSDPRLVQMAMDEANKMDEMTHNAMQELSTNQTPDAVRFFFYSQFRDCCLNQVEYLRAELMKRLGPSAYDTDEMNAFNGFNGLTEMEKNPGGSIATVLEYAPKFRRLVIRLKRKASPLSAPLALTYFETPVAPQTPAFPYKTIVTIETKTDFPSGYVLVQFAGQNATVRSDFADGKFVWDRGAVIDNPELTKLLEWNPTNSSCAVKIGKTPFSSSRPIHIFVEGPAQVHVTKALFFEE